MKYNLYPSSMTIKKYVVKRNVFTKEYVILIKYVDSSMTGICKFQTVEELQEAEVSLLEKMNQQMIDFINHPDFDTMIHQNIEDNCSKFERISEIVSISIPVMMSIIFKNAINLFLFVPLSITSVIHEIKNIKYQLEEIEEDISKYKIFISNLENFINYSKFVTGKQPLTSNTIDQYSLAELQEIRREIIALSYQEEQLKKQKIK